MGFRGSFHVFTLVSLVSVYAMANQGVLMVVKGDVQVERAGTAQKAKVGMKVQEGDTLIAGADSRAKVVMVDKNVLNISPDSKIKIEKYVFNEAKDEKKVSLDVLYGKVRSSVKQKYDGEKNTFNVKTPSAVAGVRGTDFVTQFSPVTNSTKIVTFEGQVMAGSGFDPSGKISNPVAVNPGQFTVASGGAPPAPPVEVPKSELANMSKETNAETASSGAGGNGGDRAPSGEGGEKGKGDGKEGGPAGSSPEGGGAKEGGSANPGGDRAPASGGGASMGVDQSDMTATQPSGAGPAPAFQMPVGGCTTCNLPTQGFPTMLPPELLQGSGTTNLNINIGQ